MISRKRNKHNAVILLYHGITDSRSLGIENYSQKHLPAGVFEAQLKFLKKNNNVLTLHQLVEHINRQIPFPDFSVVLTFDDGFENNYTVALPLLEKYRIPAAFFITTDFIGTKKMFWVDRLEHAINMTAKKRVDLRLMGKKFNQSLKTIQEKVFFLDRVKKLLKAGDNTEREGCLLRLAAHLEVNHTDNDNKIPNYRKLDWKQLSEMSRCPLVSIGAHSKTHAKLSRLTREELAEEIVSSRKILEERTGKKVDIFSYPEGRKDDYNQAVIEALRNSGFVCSPTAIYGDNSLKTDPFQLRRISVGFMGQPFPLSLA